LVSASQHIVTNCTMPSDPSSRSDRVKRDTSPLAV